MTPQHNAGESMSFEEFWKPVADLVNSFPHSYERVAECAWHARDSEIDSLKKRMDAMTNCYRSSENHVAQLKAQLSDALERAQKAEENMSLAKKILNDKVICFSHIAAEHRDLLEIYEILNLKTSDPAPSVDDVKDSDKDLLKARIAGLTGSLKISESRAENLRAKLKVAREALEFYCAYNSESRAQQALAAIDEKGNV